MRVKKIYLLMLLGGLSACSDDIGTAENESPESTQAALQKVVFLTENQIQQTISAFRQGDSGFAFVKSIPVTNARTETQLPLGNYQFLFAASSGNNTGATTPVPGLTLFPDMKFTAIPNTAEPAYIRESNELFLQDEKADSIYVIEGKTTIRATLKRAVARVIICIRRGWCNDDGQYTSLPYQDDSIVRYFNHIRLEIENAGTEVDARCIYEGQGTLSVTIPANSPDSLTPEGFAVYTGPFFFPAANQEPVLLKLNLYRSENSPQPDLSLSRQVTLKRNEQIILNAWVTNDWNIIGITADTEPISREIDGEQEIWDDNLTI